MSDKIFKCGLCSLFSCQSQIHNANIKIVYFMCNYFEHFFLMIFCKKNKIYE